MHKTLRNRDLGPFHDLLLRACPATKKTENGGLIHHPDGVKSITMLAAWLDMTPWGVHLWIKKSRIPPRKARQITELYGSGATLDEFSPYIYG